ncbi:MAG: ABC transporter ATP-binding protein [Burkholderiaceae bacterium]|nr:ABC transporter ATP-binding protein [Burkholderiaceae bacterium]MCD6672272.1 ABC transporter ATP-binding protein [Burkholderiaceae bacterium]
MSEAAALLSVRGLSKRFGGVRAVDRVDLDVAPRETVALIGPNGAGKTTFYNLLSGRMQPSAGSVVFGGRDVTGLPPHRISRLGISRSFQITNIFPELTARENVEVALTALHGKALRLFSRAAGDRALHGEARALLERLGLGSLAEARAGTLSYGDKRLLEIAIVLATRPRLVLLDEPTAGMTPEETRGVVELVRQLARTGEYTFLITEHDMEVVFGLADRIVVMHRGAVLAQGSVDEIRASREVREAYLGEPDD